MDVFVGILLFVAACSIVIAIEGAETTLNVVNFGAVGDGKTDDSQAFLQAWKALCGANQQGTITLIIPEGKTFLLHPVDFLGPCRSSTVQIQVLGKIVAPRTTDAWNGIPTQWWLFFSGVNNLIITGSGTIDGQGSAWWNNSDKRESKAPTALQLHKCKNLQLSGLTHINSPRNHISVNDCTGVFFSDLRIIAPEDSPNTDGIDISGSSYINIRNSYIGTGDDCVAIIGGTSYVNITKVICGPGHGISVGSLGKNGSYDTVEKVNVQYCSFNGTQNGARIKTWQGGLGFARNISFEHITLINSRNPIIIDQYYCNGEHTCKKETTTIAISDVTYSDFHGSSANEEAIRLDCNEEVGCTNIVMDHINITSSVPNVQTYAYCKNVNGTSNQVTPHVDCLRR